MFFFIFTIDVLLLLLLLFVSPRFFFALSLSISILFVPTRLEKPHHNHESVYHCVYVCSSSHWMNKIKAIEWNAYSSFWLAWHYVSGTFKCCRIEIECVLCMHFEVRFEIRYIWYLDWSERAYWNKIKINV